MGEREGKPLYYADSVYTLRSNSPPARRILARPFAKIRLREGIYYRRKRRLFNNRKRDKNNFGTVFVKEVVKPAGWRSAEGKNYTNHAAH